VNRSLTELEAGLEAIGASPSDDGRLELIVRRPRLETREVLQEGRIDESEGLLGDRWHAAATADRDAQITLTNARAMAVIAGQRARWPLAGDQLYVDLDLGEANLPAGTRLHIGEAELEVTALPHRGCGKFVRRFGADAQRFVNSEVGRAMNLRGINTRVVRGGRVRIGDAVRKAAARPAPTDTATPG